MATDVAKRILVVDDDVSVTRIMREALTTFLHCDVDTSPDPEYGFELALKKSYDLMIFDFSMPVIDGALLFSLISKAYDNANPPRAIPPLLLVSGQGEEKRAQELLKEARVRAFLPKPFVISRLLQRVTEALPSVQKRQ
jgi:CheY-like chemotaxis protein